jgi:hypothetical protein
MPITRQPTRAPALPEGWLLRSSGSAWMITERSDSGTAAVWSRLSWYNCVGPPGRIPRIFMTHVQVDQVLRQQLGGLAEPVEFCSPDGKVLGRYLPEDEYREILYGSVEIPYSDEEIARRGAETGDCSLHEIWKQVGCL